MDGSISILATFILAGDHGNSLYADSFARVNVIDVHFFTFNLQCLATPQILIVIRGQTPAADDNLLCAARAYVYISHGSDTE
jgi:hypothetical protein